VCLPLGTLFLIIWRTVLFLCLSSETSSNNFFSHRTSTPSAFEVITETRYINYLLTYLLTCMKIHRHSLITVAACRMQGLLTLPYLTCGVDACTRQTPSAEATARAQCTSPTDLKVDRTSLKPWQTSGREANGRSLVVYFSASLWLGAHKAFKFTALVFRVFHQIL